MKQKLAIARAMLHRPRLLFLDEPTAGLDPLAAAALRDDLAALVSRERVTVFLTTHNLAEAESLCGSLAVLRNGRLLATGSPGEVRAGSRRAHVDILGRGYTPEIVGAVRRRPEVASVNLAGSGGLLAVELRPGADVAGLVALIVGQGGEVEGVHRGQDSLDDAFRALMSEAS